jgi:hypothetical protein
MLHDDETRLNELSKDLSNFRLVYDECRIEEMYTKVEDIESRYPSSRFIRSCCRDIRGKLRVYIQTRRLNRSHEDIPMMETEIQIRKDILSMIEDLLEGVR